MKRLTFMISLIFSVLLIFLILQFGQSRIFVVSKAFWPAWDAFAFKLESQGTWYSKTSFKNYDTFREAYYSFVNKESDALISTIFEAILAKSRGVPVKIVMILDYTVGADQLVSKRYDSLSLVEGATIGAEKATISHYTALMAIEKSGLSLDEVEFVYKPMNELARDYSQNKLDILSTYEPYATYLNSNQSNVIFSSKEIPRQICDVLMINTEKISENSHQISKWKKSWINTVKDIEKDEASFKSKIKTYYQELDQDFDFSTKGIYLTGDIENQFAFSQQGYLYDSLKSMMNFMIKQGVINGPVDLKSMLPKVQ